MLGATKVLSRMIKERVTRVDRINERDKQRT